MVPLDLFRSTTFAGANLLTLFLDGALGGALFFLPLNLVQIQGYSATAAGAALLPFVLILFVLSRWAGGLVDREAFFVGYRAVMAIAAGLALASAGVAWFMIRPTSHGGSRPLAAADRISKLHGQVRLR
jgi:hypothetical protein